MATIFQILKLKRKGPSIPAAVKTPVVPAAVTFAPPVNIAPNDSLVAYFLSNPAPVEVEKLQLDSPALRALRAAGIKLAVPLVSQGELVGLLNLGPRLSQQDYTADDRSLLSNLAVQAAPAVRVAQLLREQRAQARQRERVEQELKVARLIQQTLLPKELPALPGWSFSAYYQPAREVGGDFYDFINYEDGRIGLVIGDVTDKGVPAALVMATTRSILRSSVLPNRTPGEVLERANDLLYPDIPPKMFVTCLYAILDPASGRFQFANAGHDLPYWRHRGQVSELRATGMPLGLMPGMSYEEKECLLEPGESILFYSDGLVEAHNNSREMFSFPRLMTLMGDYGGEEKQPLTEFLLKELADFTGGEWEQEDDITLVTLHREQSLPEPKLLADFVIASQPGNERLAMDRVAEAIKQINLSSRNLERLKTAVAEATMNAMEHGNHYQADLPVLIQVRASDQEVAVSITDKGGSQFIPEAETPDLEAKLAEMQTPRGWGLFLIKNLVDKMEVQTAETNHTIQLTMNLEGASHDL